MSALRRTSSRKGKNPDNNGKGGRGEGGLFEGMQGRWEGRTVIRVPDGIGRKILGLQRPGGEAVCVEIPPHAVDGYQGLAARVERERRETRRREREERGDGPAVQRGHGRRFRDEHRRSRRHRRA